MTGRFPKGFALAAGVAAFGVRARSLTLGGGAAAMAIGGTIFGAGGMASAMPMVAFFASSTALGRLGRRDIEHIQAKGDCRDARQVLANGGAPALAALGSQMWPTSRWNHIYLSCLAAATADTWATAVGRASSETPRLIISGRPVPPGTSGGVTVAGLIASVTGAMVIAITGHLRKRGPGPHIAPIVLCGVAGSLTDSLLGALVQERRACPTCGTLTEQHVHTRCGSATVHSSGFAAVDNDMVNFISVSCAGALAFMTGIVLRTPAR